MARARKKSARKQAAPNAVEMLLMDHETVNGLFRQFEKLHEAEEDTDKVIDSVRSALTQAPHRSPEEIRLRLLSSAEA